MKQTDPQMKIRLPPDLKAKVEQAAVSGNRSMGAEIVARLEASFSGEDSHDGQPIDHIEVTLDTNGFPISWHEINEHIGAIRTGLKASVVKMTVSVITPELVSSGDRKPQTAALRKAYASSRRTKMLERIAAGSAEKGSSS